METIFQDMKELYAARRLSRVDAFMDAWIAPTCVVMGTALGELQRGREEVRELIDSDLRYWYDLSIDDGRVTREELGEYVYMTCPATISYTIHENEARYQSYAAWCGRIAGDSAATPAQKGAQIAFILDTLLSSRQHKRRKNVLGVTIRALLRGGKAAFIDFAFDKTRDSADDYLGGGGDTAESYGEERGCYTGAPLPAAADYVRAQGIEDALLESPDGQLFYGVGVERRGETLDEAMAALLAENREGDAYQSLFDLRLRIAYLQKIYALEEHPRAIVRFFGLMAGDAVSLFVPVYPLSTYLEWH